MKSSRNNSIYKIETVKVSFLLPKDSKAPDIMTATHRLKQEVGRLKNAMERIKQYCYY